MPGYGLYIRSIWIAYFIIFGVLISRVLARHRRIEEALKQSEERYRDLFENANDAICIIDSDLNYKDVNKKLVELLGYSREELLGMNILDVIPPEQIPRSKIEFDKLRKNGSYEKFIGKVRTKDGRIIDVEINSSAIIDGNKIIGSRDIIRDITERKQAEEKLQQERDRAQKYLDIAGVMIVVINADQKVVLINKKGCEILEYEENEIVGRNWFDSFLPETIRDEIKAMCKRSVADGAGPAEYFENPVLTRSGKERIIAWHNTVLRDEEGRIIATLSSGEDITERKYAEEELLKFKLGIERSDEVIFITDKEGSITYTNPAFERIYGFSRDEALGKTPRILKSGVLPQEVYKQFWDTIIAKKVVSGEIINKTKDGRLLNTENTANPILNSDGDIIGFLAIQRDITEHKRSEDELKIKAQLLDKANDSIFVHDLDGNFIYLNETAYRSHGYSRDEMMNMNLYSIITPEYSRLANQRTLDLVEKGEAVFESAHLDKNRSIIPVEVHACIIESGGKKLILCVARDITERKQAERMLKEKARAELYGFIVSALPVFASNVPSQVRNTLIINFAERFEKNARPGFEEEMKRLGYDQRIGAENTQEILDVLMPWLLGLFSNFGIQTRTTSEGIKRDIEFLNCPWIDEASGNPIFCFICRAMVIRSFTWTALKGSADQKTSIANGSQTCRFEIHARSIL